MLKGRYDIGFTMDLACKDAGLAVEFGRRFGVPLRLAAVMEQTFIEGRAKYGGETWSSMIVKLLEGSVGTSLRAPGFPARPGAGEPRRRAGGVYPRASLPRRIPAPAQQRNSEIT